jgi:putative two-component system response regulator
MLVMTDSNTKPASHELTAVVQRQVQSEYRLTGEWALSHESPHTQRIFMVDDEELNIRVVRKYLRSWGFEQIDATTDPTKAVARITRELPDLVLLDVMMPEVSGMDILCDLRADQATCHLPVIILSAHVEDDIRHQALMYGANDFIGMPIDPLELQPRVTNMLKLHAHQKCLEQHSVRLEAEVRRRTAELDAAQHHVVHCLARAAEYRDNDTGRHIIRVGLYAGLIARALGLGDDFATLMEQAAKLHDVGKIGIPDSILQKTGKLDPDEYRQMQSHCDMGLQVLRETSEDDYLAFRKHALMGGRILDQADTPLLRMASQIALTHHEKWDGSGYPFGLKGEEIPLVGRIVAVADVFDALSTRRVYKPAFPLEQCYQILEAGRGSQFDPQVLDAFLSQHAEMEVIRIRFTDVE